jgi:flagellar hook-associated protein 2
MSDLVDALNSVAGELKNDTDPNSGALNNDPARSLQNTLTTLGSTVIMPNAAAGAPKTLSDLGLVIQRDGTFTLDSNRLSATLANYPSDPRPCSPTACMASTPRSTRSRATSPRQWTPVR